MVVAMAVEIKGSRVGHYDVQGGCIAEGRGGEGAGVGTGVGTGVGVALVALVDTDVWSAQTMICDVPGSFGAVRGYCASDDWGRPVVKIELYRRGPGQLHWSQAGAVC